MNCEESGDLVRIERISKSFRSGASVLGGKGRVNKAVDDLSFAIPRGQTFALVGESGSGKSTTGRLILRLVEPDSGQVWFDGREVTGLSAFELRGLRREMQIIFQDPYSSLNPRMRVGTILEEPFAIHGEGNRRARKDRVAALLESVGLAADVSAKYPHEFSGGQRQRIGIARAIALNPRFIVCDEPVSALDVSVQAQIVNLLQDLQERLGLTYLFISHGLPVVRHIANRVGIMYAGKLVEMAPVNEIFDNPLHPYTKSLLAAVPPADPTRRLEPPALTAMGQPGATGLSAGCAFVNRCPEARSRCSEAQPVLAETAKGHFVACFAVAEATGK